LDSEGNNVIVLGSSNMPRYRQVKDAGRAAEDGEGEIPGSDSMVIGRILSNPI
jgi:curli biogenesis system outer membrane secretion channel CsgG